MVFKDDVLHANFNDYLHIQAEVITYDKANSLWTTTHSEQMVKCETVTRSTVSDEYSDIYTSQLIGAMCIKDLSKFKSRYKDAHQDQYYVRYSVYINSASINNGSLNLNTLSIALLAVESNFNTKDYESPCTYILNSDYVFTVDKNFYKKRLLYINKQDLITDKGVFYKNTSTLSGVSLGNVENYTETRSSVNDHTKPVMSFEVRPGEYVMETYRSYMY